MISHLIYILIVIFVLIIFAWPIAAVELQKKACVIHLTQQPGGQTLSLRFKKDSLKSCCICASFHSSITVRAVDSELDKRSCFSSWSCHRRLGSNHDIHTHTNPVQILQYQTSANHIQLYTSLWCVCEAFWPFIICSGQEQTTFWSGITSVLKPFTKL